MPHCLHCGMELRDEDASCTNCGQKVMADSPAPPSPPEASSPGTAELHVGKLLSTGWSIFKQYPLGFVGYTILFIILVIISSVLPKIGMVFYIPYFPMMAGVLVVSAKVLQRQPYHFGDFFAGFRFFLPLILLAMVSGFIVTLGLILLIIPGIYLSVAYVLAPLFIMDQRVGFWSAMGMSRHTVAPYWFKIFGLFLLLALINLGGALLLGLGLLVTIPLTWCCITAVYAEMVGFKSIQFYRDLSEPAAPETLRPAEPETAAPAPAGLADKTLARKHDWVPAVILIGFMLTIFVAGWYYWKSYKPVIPKQPVTVPTSPPKETAAKPAVQPKETQETAPKLTAKDYLNKGIETKDLQEKINFYTKAIELDPNYALAFNNRGSAYHDKKDYGNALNDYTRAIELNPKYALAYNNRGYLFYEIKEYDKAISDYNMAISLKPDYYTAYNNRGNGYLRKKDYEHALIDFNKAISLKSDNYLAYFYRGIVYYDLKNYGLALNDFNIAISLKPDYASAYYRRAMVHNQTGDHEQARNDYNKAKSLNPRLPDLDIKSTN